MPAAYVVWGIVILGILAVSAAVFVPGWSVRSNRLGREQRAELAASRVLIKKIDKLAYNNRDVNPELSTQIGDEIYTFKNTDNNKYKELN